MISKRTKNLLITGLSGYLGNFLQKELLGKKYRIFALEKEKTSFINNKKIKVLKGDISKLEDLSRHKKVLRTIDIVVHLAAYVPQSAILDDLEQSAKVNIIGSLNLIRYLREGVKFIFASTCEVYGKNENAEIKEFFKAEPASFYGISKLASEKYLQAFCFKKNINLVVLRFASIYGPGEKISRAIPNFIKSALKNEPVYIFGDGSEKRSFIFGTDAAEAIIKVIESKKTGIFNIASNEITTISNLAEIIIKLSNSNSKIVFKPREKVKTNIVLNIAHAKKELKFRPKIKLETGLKKEIDSFKESCGGLVIVFDLDGTILDISRKYYEIYKFILKKRNFKTLSKKKYWAIKKNKIKEDFIVKKTCPVSFVSSYKKERNKIIEDRRFLIFDRVIPGAKATMEKLRGECRLYLVTMRRSRKNLFWQLRELSLEKYFKKIFSFSEKPIGHLNTRRNFIQKIKKEESSFGPDFLMIIGDTEADIMAGKKEGIITYAVLSGLRSRKFLFKFKPNHIVTNINELPNLLKI